MKKLLSIVVAGVFLAAGLGLVRAEDSAFVASKGGEKYHYADCSVAKKISTDKLVKYAKPEDAVKEGYKPCKVCNPPPSADALVATQDGGKYHKQNCKMVGNMKTENKVYYKDTAVAEKAGYKPCGVCLKK
ncbi:MAG: hypothetical protein HGA80_02740 [Candidatus Omnitrophica bacterium]|nr:hypothetical protein [Candidatus Omnitrophota bacterium]